MKDEKLDAIRERYIRTTPGPWKRQHRVYAGPVFVHVGASDTAVTAHANAHDAEFVAHAVTDVPYLLHQVEAQRQKAAGFAAALLNLRDENEKLKKRIAFLEGVTRAQSPR